MEINRVSPEDYPGILQLQTANYIGNLSSTERLDGYMSAEYTAQQIAEMAGDLAVIVAREGNQVLGFLCATSPDYSPQPPVVDRLVQEFDGSDYQGRLLNAYRWFLYGPVVIDRRHRGRGLLRKLFTALLREVSGKYEIGVAFVSDDNRHSLEAHVHGLGMSQVGYFEHGAQGYHVLAFSLPDNEQGERGLAGRRSHLS